MVLRPRARGPRWACAVVQVPASCARRALGGIVRWAIGPLGAGSAGARADLFHTRGTAQKVPGVAPRAHGAVARAFQSGRRTPVAARARVPISDLRAVEENSYRSTVTSL